MIQKTSRLHTIVILGAGYSGTLTSVNILRKAVSEGIHILLIEGRLPFARGLAYHSWDDNLLLNVPAGNMSALADEPGYFVSYCQNIDPAFNAHSFISRRIYGDYLEHTLAQAEKESLAVLHKVEGHAVAVHPFVDSTGFSVQMANGEIFSADQLVLAFGHLLPKNPGLPSDFFATDSYIGNSWDFAALDGIDHDCPVLLIGSGHTAIDTLFRLTSSHPRKVFLVSRRGLRPHVHRSMAHQTPLLVAFPSYLHEVPCTVRAYLHALRNEVAKRERCGGNWRDVINELRPHTSAIWSRFNLAERRRFLIHTVAFWDIHRHRISPSAHWRLTQMLNSGQVEIIPAYIQSYDPCDEGVNVRLRLRHEETTKVVRVDTVVNCTGPNYNISTSTMPLIKQLSNDGLLKQDSMKIGLELDDQYQLIDSHGTPVNRLYYVGPMLKARYWEAIAVPELRGHTLDLAKIILAEIEHEQ